VGIKVLLRGLTPVGVASSWVLGTLSWAAFGPGAYSIVCLYFVIGSLVTKVKLEQKQKEGTAEARSGRRSLGSVFGSGIAGIVCTLLALVTGNPDLWRIGFVASFVSKFADTVSSEIGKAYGTKTYLVTSFQQVPRGTEGAVSLEGTGAGILGAMGLSAVAIVLRQVTWMDAVLVVVAAVVANYLESVLGATVQGTGKVQWLTNDIVNGLQISLAAIIALGLHHYWGLII